MANGFRGRISESFTFMTVIICMAICIVICSTKLMNSNLHRIVEKGETTKGISDDVYHSERVFRINYAEMEKKFKIYVYPEEEECTNYEAKIGKYASEVNFFRSIRESQFLTKKPDKAHLFFIPISLQNLYQKESSIEKISSIAGKCVKSLIQKYPYWNRTLGADHFFLTCLDHHVDVPMLVKNTIRVVCSSSYKSNASQFIPHKDVALPSVMQPLSKPASARNNLIQRKILGFWAGSCNSDTRKTLVHQWGGDAELNIQNTTIHNMDGRMKILHSAKFCICPGGSRITNSRITLAIDYGCVPVILDDYLVLPFNDILDWRKFSIVVKERDVCHLKRILNAKAGDDYRKMYINLIKVKRHFQWNTPAVKYDAFHMVLYDLWLRRHVVRYF